MYGAPEPGFAEQVYWLLLNGDSKGNTLAMLRNARRDKAVVVRFNTEQLPCFTQWKCTAGPNEGYVTGLEPGTNFPNPKPFERQQGRVVRLAPGQVYRTVLTLEVHDTARGVKAVTAEIAKLQGRRPAVVHSAPIPGLSPVG